MTLSIPTNSAFASLRSENIHATLDFPNPSDFTNMDLPDGNTLWFARRDHASGEIYYLVKILRSGEQQIAILDTGRMNPSERMAFLLYQCQMDRIQFREERRVANERLSASNEQVNALYERMRASEEQRRTEREAREQRMQASEEQRRVEREANEVRFQAEINAFNEQMDAYRRQNEVFNGSSSRPSDQLSVPYRSGSAQIQESLPLVSTSPHSSMLENNVASNGENPEENPSTSLFETIQASISFFLPKSFRA